MRLLYALDMLALKYKLKNNYLAQIMWEQMVFLGNPEFGCDLQPIDFATVARGFGPTAFTLEDPWLAGSVVNEGSAV